MTQPVPYLHFPGCCTEAMRFYEQALGGKLVTLLTYGASPAAEHCAADSHHLIMHARLELPGGYSLMAGDSPSHVPHEGIRGVMLTLSYDSEARAQQVFEALAVGGNITMPLQPAFWAKIWGMCTDRFGIDWAVNGVLLPI